jgi:hypothetical protein
MAGGVPATTLPASYFTVTAVHARGQGDADHGSAWAQFPPCRMRAHLRLPASRAGDLPPSAVQLKGLANHGHGSLQATSARGGEPSTLQGTRCAVRRAEDHRQHAASQLAGVQVVREQSVAHMNRRGSGNPR